MTANEFLACNLALKPTDHPCSALQIGIMDDEILPCVMSINFESISELLLHNMSIIRTVTVIPSNGD